MQVRGEAVLGRRVMITGGCGFIGSHLARRVARAGASSVVLVDHLRSGDPANVGQLDIPHELVRHALGWDDRAALARALAGCDLVFHLAAEKHNASRDDPARVLRSNEGGTRELLEEAARAGVRKVVFSSSLYAYGRTTGPRYVETEPALPTTVYGASKLAGEKLVEAANARGLPGVSLRYLFTYGPRQHAGLGYKSVIVRTFERLLAGERPEIRGDGLQELDYVFVDDVVEATLAAMQAPVSGVVLNVGSGRATRVRDLVALAIAVAGRDTPPLYVAADETAGTSRVADPGAAERLLGFRAGVSLEDGLSRTWEWMRSRAESGPSPPP